jgi:hypothetical protein
MNNWNKEKSNILKVCTVVSIGTIGIAGCTANTEVKTTDPLNVQSYEEPKDEISVYNVKDYDGKPVTVTCNGFESFKDIQIRMKYVDVSFDGAVRAMQIIDAGNNIPTVPEYIQITYAANGITDANSMPPLDTLSFPNNCERFDS